MSQRFQGLILGRSQILRVIFPKMNCSLKSDRQKCTPYVCVHIEVFHSISRIYVRLRHGPPFGRVIDKGRGEKGGEREGGGEGGEGSFRPQKMSVQRWRRLPFLHFSLFNFSFSVAFRFFSCFFFVPLREGREGRKKPSSGDLLLLGLLGEKNLAGCGLVQQVMWAFQRHRFP